MQAYLGQGNAGSQCDLGVELLAMVFQVLQDFIHNLNQSALGFVENFIARPSLAKLTAMKRTMPF